MTILVKAGKVEKIVGKVAIANATPYCIYEGQYYLDPSEFISLAQWFPLFDKTILLKPHSSVSTPPPGWVPLSNDIEVAALCSVRDGRHRRLVCTRLAAEKSLRGVDFLYVRMPNYEGYHVFKVAKRLGIPLLLELHGDWVSAIREEDSRDLIRRFTRWGRVNLAEHAVRRMASYASAIVTIGPKLKEKYSRQDKPTLISTNHLLPLASYCPREDFQLKNPPVFLYVGDIQRRKGLLVLFEALNDLKKMGYAFQMVMVGDGPLQNELQVYANQKGFANWVVFTGRTPHGPDLFDCYKKADVFVLPSIAAEGVPRVIHEAMAFGCPVIATDIGSVAWQLEGGCGLVIPPNSIHALRDALLQIIDDEQLRSELSKKAFKRSLKYSIEEQKMHLSEFIRSIS